MQPDPLSEAYEFARLGRLEEAEERLRLVLAANANNAAANHLMGAIRFHQDRVDDALPFLTLAVSSSAATAEMHCILGAALHRLAKKGEAIEAYERALAIKPGHTDALNGLANLYREEQNSAQSSVAAQPAAFKP